MWGCLDLVSIFFSLYQQEYEERMEEQEGDADALEEEKSRLNDKISGFKKDIEGLEDNLKKVRGKILHKKTSTQTHQSSIVIFCRLQICV